MTKKTNERELVRRSVSIAGKFMERDRSCSSVRIVDPDDPEVWAGIVLVGNDDSRKATFTDVLWILQKAVMEGTRLGALTPEPSRIAVNAAIAPHTFRDEDLLDAYVELRAAGHEDASQDVKSEIMKRLQGIRSR